MPQDPDAPLDPDDLGRSLAEVFAVLGPLYRRAARSVEKEGEAEGLPIGVRAVLELLQGQGPRPVPRIAETLGLSRQFVQRMVDVGLAQGLLELRPNPAHQRSALIALTEPGAHRITQVQEREQVALGATGGDLTRRDVESCLKVLRHLLSVVDPVEEDPKFTA